MKEFIFIVFSILMLSCSLHVDRQKYGEHQADEIIRKDSVSAIFSEKASSLRDKRGRAVCERVAFIYCNVFDWYDNAEKNPSLLQGNPDFESLYTSADYNKLFCKVKEIDERKSVDGFVGFFDYDHWVCGQDFQNLSMRIISCKKEKTYRYKVTVMVCNCGTNILVELDMVFEKGQWMIDDFCRMPNNADSKKVLSEKTRMRRYLAAEND